MAADHNLVVFNGNANFLVVFANSPVDKLHRPGGDDGHPVGCVRLADRFHGPDLPGQTAAVGGNAVDLFAIQLDQHPAQRIAAVLVIRGKNRAADQLAEKRSGQLVAIFFLKRINAGKLRGVFRR